jgi:hypothetical protein
MGATLKGRTAKLGVKGFQNAQRWTKNQKLNGLVINPLRQL